MEALLSLWSQYTVIAEITGAVFFFVVLFSARWKGQSWGQRLWRAVSEWYCWDPLFSPKPQYEREEEAERARLAKRDARKPGRLTDFE
ncbi:hypothetical protein ABAC460_23400 [Asticcacaulis sp. AC460]|uniref:hypothetical protein n=1 Tax=Asticcacaulis sp. AC460 TaxID=1282360 RepID=UPI0003C3E1BA|nr:hypothetical protein [Asticcacaulis sp. AC460]ESQ86460.1 hypothetical protein ABAC460_23400 [Asticcacaulis sp. AC460]